ncbi:MAG: glycoside hydrolase [Chloroflexi bacterium AL-W]|nr:glycoside hydrolase [Chloroflexi bacterium AL-W]
MLKKQILQKGDIVKVKFETHPLPEAQTAFLVGDFNGWDEKTHPMKKRKTDDCFTIELKLEPNNEYHFRYLIDGDWHNEWEADKYASNPFGGDNSIVIT